MRVAADVHESIAADTATSHLLRASSPVTPRHATALSNANADDEAHNLGGATATAKQQVSKSLQIRVSLDHVWNLYLQLVSD